MLETQSPGAIRNALSVASMTLVLSGCLMQDEIEDVGVDAALESEYEVSGSVGDGPVVGASMRVIRNDGVLLNEFESDASAGYNIRIRTKGKYYPLTIDARNGIDIVTNLSPDFVLIGAALEPSKKYVVNVSPFSTLTMEIAQDLPGGRSKENIYAAQDIAVSAMNCGLVSLLAKGPMTTRIDSSNVAEIVKSAEALGEIVRRTRDWLLSAGYVWDGDAVIRAMGSDLIDSVIDGVGGPRSDARMAAIASIVIAQVLLESVGNELHVNGVHATANLEAAIQMMNLGVASPALGELTANSAMLAQINLGLAAADAISNDVRVTDLRQSVSGIQPGLQPDFARSILPQDYRQILDDVLLLLIGGDASTIATVNDVVRNGGVIPDNNRAPTIDGTPGVTVDAGSMYQFLPSASDADGDPLTFSVSNQPAWTSFDAATGLLSGLPSESDIGLYSGIVISVSDGQITSSLPAFTISVASAFSNTPPTISGFPSVNASEGTRYSFIPSASDADQDALTFSISGRPPWTIFDSSSGELSGTPASGDVGVHGGIVITVSDGLATSSLVAFSITVQGVVTNSRPTISGVPAAVITANTLYEFTPTASDADQDPLTFSISGRPLWTTFDSSSGTLSGTPTSADVGVHGGIVISVSDGSATRSLPTFSITVNAANTVETIVDNLDANTVQTGTWTDSGNANPYLSNSVYCVSGCLFTWQPVLPISATYEVYVYWTYHPRRTTTASYQIDHDGGTDTMVVSQRDSSSSNQWYSMGTYNLTAGVNGDVSLSYDESEFDVSVLADAVRYVLINAGPDTGPPTDPTGLSATASSGSEIDLAWTASTDDVVVAGYYVYQDGNYTTPAATTTTSSYSVPGLAPNTLYTFQVTAFDLAGNESGLSNVATATTLEAAANSPPQINGTPSPSVNVGQGYTFTPTGSDPDGGNLTFNIQNMPPWAQFDTATGALSGTPQAGDAGSYANISISVSDGNLSDTLPNFTITVNQVSLGSATLNWLPPTQNEDGTALIDLAGYNIYWGAPGNYTNSVTINNPGLTSYVVDNLAPGTYEFVATALNAAGVESQYSNSVTKTIP